MSSDNLNAGFRIQLWATEWQQLSSEANNEYKEKTKIIGKKCAAVNCLRKIKKLVRFYIFFTFALAATVLTVTTNLFMATKYFLKSSEGFLRD